MKKLLLASVAVSGLAFAAAPAHAGIELELGGFFKGYGVFVDQDEAVFSAATAETVFGANDAVAASGGEATGFDIVRDTELHIGGETTLDNGLSVGVHVEITADADSSIDPDETYVYFSGDWGRVNVGTEDGAGYLLQVAAPSADSNIDGVRQYIQPFANTGLGNTVLDYDMNNVAGKADKITYLSPIFSGFQVGVSYTPDSEDAATNNGVNVETNTAGDTNETYEIAARYEGEFEGVGVIAGAGYALGSEEGGSTTTDDHTEWNVGLDLDFAGFGVGVVYKEDDDGLDGTAAADIETLVVGVDYTTGAFKLGASYLNQDTDGGDEFDRYTAGVNYEYGPGMSFRGSVQFVDRDVANTTADLDGTAVLLGTQINF